MANDSGGSTGLGAGDSDVITHDTQRLALAELRIKDSQIQCDNDLRRQRQADESWLFRWGLWMYAVGFVLMMAYVFFSHHLDGRPSQWATGVVSAMLGAVGGYYFKSR